MPFFTHHKQHSWPPFRTSSPVPTSSSSSAPRSTSTARQSNQKNNPDREIDSNPFSFFISPPISEDEAETDSEEEDIFASAGIAMEKTRSRSLSPIPFGRRTRDRDFEEADINFYDRDPIYQTMSSRPRSPKSVLNRFIEKHVHRETEADEDPVDVGGTLTRSRTSTSLTGLTSGIGIARGRVGYDLGPISQSVPVYYMGVTRGRQHIRTHSPRPRSWREPSPALWPLLEEEREESFGGSTMKDDDLPLLSRSI